MNETKEHPSFNRRAAAVKILMEMMRSASKEQIDSLSIAVSCIMKREKDKAKNRAKRRAVKETEAKTAKEA